VEARFFFKDCWCWLWH